MSTDRIIVLLTLKPGRDAASYEHWARTTDLPIVRGLGSVADFRVYRATGLLGGGTAPYDYVEVLDIADPDRFAVETGTNRLKQVAGEFADWANAVFIRTSELAA